MWVRASWNGRKSNVPCPGGIRPHRLAVKNSSASSARCTVADLDETDPLGR